MAHKQIFFNTCTAPLCSVLNKKVHNYPHKYAAATRGIFKHAVQWVLNAVRTTPLQRVLGFKHHVHV